MTKASKRISLVALLLVLLLVVCTFIGCGGPSNEPPHEPTDTSSQDKPDNPDNPDDSVNPDKPDNPDNPDDTVNPDNPDDSVNPDNPDDSDNPDNPDTPNVHTHTFSEEWSYNLTHHWKEATCEHGDEISEYGPHTYDKGLGGCDACSMVRVPTEGLEYTLSDDGNYYIVTDIGEATDDVIVIPDIYEGLPVEVIGASAFAYTNIKEVQIASTIKTIENDAFSNCRSLSSVIFETGALKTIGKSAFMHCTSLLYVTLPPSLEHISENAFIQSGNLHLVYVPKSVKVIENFAFNICDELTVCFEADSIPEDFGMYWDDCKMSIVKRLLNCKNVYGETDNGIIWCEKNDGTIAICGYNERYQSDDGSVAVQTPFDLYIPEYINGKEVTELIGYAFRDITVIKKLVIPKTVSKISNYLLFGADDTTEPLIDEIEISSENSYYYSEGNYIIEKASGKEIRHDGAYITFGEFPQTIKSASVTISGSTNSQGYYTGSDGCYYAKLTATPPIGSYYMDGVTHYFSNGEKVIWGNTYYFKVEPIRWRVLEEENGNEFVICENVIWVTINEETSGTSVHGNYMRAFYETVECQWLNNDFYQKAFTATERDRILTSDVDNSTRSWVVETDEITQHKIYLPSLVELKTEKYGFNGNLNSTGGEKCVNRKIIATDFAICQGAPLIAKSTMDEYGEELNLTGRESQYMTRTESKVIQPLGGDDMSSHMYDEFGLCPVMLIKE
ncbi:MAG: leucine-rich repeat protein [Clostridia bacterium]|nr:leucine-rich repeat protein [Clostridia bacterium]